MVAEGDPARLGVKFGDVREGRGMDEQRYVVEITRPVPPEKVGQVAQRIAERLNVPHERIVTLLDGRVGEVTKPVLADKADAIAEVFAEAGVRVLVAAARVEPPHYQERFGEPLPPESEPPPHAPEASETQPLSQAHEPQLPPQSPEPADQDDDVPWGQDDTWGYDAGATDNWSRRSAQPVDEPTDGQEEASNEANYDATYEATYEAPADDPEEIAAEPPEDPAAREPSGAPVGPSDQPLIDEQDGDYDDYQQRVAYVSEEEADRLGPTVPGGGTDRHDVGNLPSRYAASTRWTPSPHDPYALTPEDSPGFDGKRVTPVGPARTSPLGPRESSQQFGGGRDPGGGFYSPDDDEPTEGPRLRVFLLWALAISLLVLVLLQFVMALRVDDVAVLSAYETGLEAYRRGDFGAARKVWEPLAEAGNAQAQYFLGFMVQNGLGQPWSNARAANWYQRAAHQGVPAAQLALGDLYLRGLGVQLDPTVGATWYASAAVAGDPAGQYEYAKLLLHGVGVQQDMGAALAWFEAAAANGVEAAADYVEYARANAGLLAQDTSGQ